MLSIQAQCTLSKAKQYFREHLQVGDYYSQIKSVKGQWIGKGAELLNLQDSVEEQSFLKLVEGLNPSTGDKLTLRANTTREENGQIVFNKRFFYDFCFAPPKSVSIVALLKDPQITKVHDRCVREAVQLLETYAATRVRKQGQNTNRITGNIACALFSHDTSRSLDPLLHTHCIVMNATHDPVESRWKALENNSMIKVQKFIHQVYTNSFIRELHDLGYELNITEKSFEIKNISNEIIKKFSKRLTQIEEAYEQEKDLVKNKNMSKEALQARIATEKRSRKQKSQDPEQLKTRWMSELTSEQQKTLKSVGPKMQLMRPFIASKQKHLTLSQAFERAEEIVFERHTSCTKEKLLTTVLEVSRGSTHTFKDILQTYSSRPYLNTSKSDRITLKNVLNTEAHILYRVRSKKSIYEPFLSFFDSEARNLSPEQTAAVGGILKNKDFVVFFKGSAGTGKSFTLKVIAEELQQAGHKVHIFAPQRQQVSDLGKDGLKAETLASLLLQKKPPMKSVWIIDEAGQIGGKQMKQLLDLAADNGNRIIFSGDTKQHGAITASDALIALEKHGSIATFELKDIRRQNPEKAQNLKERQERTQYRKAVQEAAQGNPGESLLSLDKLGWVREAPPEKAVEDLVESYIEKLSAQKNCLIVSQTHKALESINAAVKERLKQANQLGPEQFVEVFKAKDKIVGQKKDSTHYELGDYVLFHRSYGPFEKGDLLPVVAKNQTHLFLEKYGEQAKISLKYAERFNICAKERLSIAEGERLQIKFNGLSKEGKKILNGELVTFRGLNEEGDLKIQDDLGFEKTLSPNQAILNPGYALTSYASQGKTVDFVLVYDSQNRSAINQKEWYVSISRAREKVEIFTPNVVGLFCNISRSGDRQLALEADFEEKKIELEQGLDIEQESFELDLERDLGLSAVDLYEDLHTLKPKTTRENQLEIGF